MPDETNERGWIIEPPAAGEVHVHVQLGEGVELNEVQREALEVLVNSFHEGEADVKGFAAACPDQKCTIAPPGCSPFRSCNPEYTDPCLMHSCVLTDCHICSGKAAFGIF